MQAISGIIGAADDLNVVDIEREDHVEIAHVAAIDVARDTVDQQLDAVDVALAVEGTKGRLARFVAEAEFGELHAWHLADEFPTVRNILVLHPFSPHHIDRGQDTARRQSTSFARINCHFAQDDG